MASRIPNPFAKPVKTGRPVVPHGLIPVGDAMHEKFLKRSKRKAAPPTKGGK